ncbi:NAD(P)-binding protein [Myxococcus sp. K15C18031901]|uniref:FAD-dependent oxidoreductase n=1 Tax=Myxococcus dinghuensis TaxID=2906761 RepID=UPI0020A70B90|nr:FAD-dependent oxidoreductase [Myxococcus dinghuensis]MCP3100719.1 NAD(P)-binding protein [Myxococcus dinghuensis]
MPPPRTASPAPRAAADTRPSVTIFGAGIAGLTAAHELVVRGFDVTVVEPGPTGGLEGPMQVGGMARTQYAIAPVPAPGSNAEGPTPARPARQGEGPAGSGLFPVDVAFSPDKSTLGPEAREALDKVVEWFAQDENRRATGVSLHPPARLPSSKEGRRGLERLARVRDYLTQHPRHPLPNDNVLDGRPESTEGIRLRARVLALPGEQGVREFPAYYRHVFDTLSRIPLMEAGGGVTSRTVLDDMRAAPHHSFAETGPNPLIFPPHPLAHPSDWVRQVARLPDTGYSHRDIVQFLNRVLRYMATSSARRAAEYEDISWAEYLRGHDTRTGQSLYTYSPQFTGDLDFSPRLPAAVDAAVGEARACGDTYVQRLVSGLEPSRSDGTLNAPTTEAWLEPWQAFLAHRGVRFVTGRLEELALEDDGRLVAYMASTEAGGPVRVDESTYVLVATDVVTAERVSQRLPPVGVPGRLRGYTTRVPRAPGGSDGAAHHRDPLHSQLGLEPWDRLRAITGIQLFFQEEFKLADGCLHMRQTPWALSSVSSPPSWRFSPSDEMDGFLSVTHVGIGDWNVADGHGRSMWGATREEIALGTLEQRAASLKHVSESLPRPRWYHLDENLEFDAVTGKLNGIRTPFLIPVKRDWKNRPGANPWDPTQGAAPSPQPTPSPHFVAGVWQAPHGGYEVHWGRLLYAGTYLRTFTRMTNMEAANESARHAVNAILDHRLKGQDAEHPPHATTPRGDYDPRWARPTRFGDYCRIWNPEENELARMKPLKELDAWLFERGLPHVWDVLGLEALNASLAFSSQLLDRLRPKKAAAASPAPTPWLGGLPWLGTLLPGLSIPNLLKGIPGMPSAEAGPDGSHTPPPAGPEAFYQWLKQLREQMENDLQKRAGGRGPKA